MRLQFITALSQKKNNLLPGLVKLSQFLLLAQEGQANSSAEHAELGGVPWSRGRNTASKVWGRSLGSDG